MNGAIADPAVRTISTPKVSKITISGNNQNFFLTRRNPQRSLMNSIISFFLSTSFDESLQKSAFMKLSLSKMIFTHQMVRMILLEQVYRALTILKNEKYHHWPPEKLLPKPNQQPEANCLQQLHLPMVLNGSNQ